MDLFISSFEISIIVTKATFRSLLFSSTMLHLSGTTIVGLLGSSGEILFWLLLTVFFTLASCGFETIEIVMLISGFVFIGQIFCCLFSVSFLKCGFLCCLIGKSSANLLGVTTGDSQYKLFLGIGNLHLGIGRSWKGFGGGVLKRNRNTVFHQDLLSPLAMGIEKEERQQQVVCYWARNGSGPLNKEERQRNEEIQSALLAYLFFWKAKEVGSQRMPAGGWRLGQRCEGGGVWKEGLHNPLEIQADMKREAMAAGLLQN